MEKMVIVVMAALVLLTGCGSFWEDQGTAAVRNADARLSQAQAARQNAQAAIIEAQAQGSLAESQAQALTQSIDAVTDLADDGEYVAVFAVIALAVLAFAGWAIYATHRRPAATPAHPPQYTVPQIERGVTIETVAGNIRLVQEPEETRYHFMMRVQSLAEAISQAEREGRLLDGPEEVRR